ncbi:MAG: benzoate-CoA ligase family protein [Hyphomicrobiaceae bacterium]|nr:MAG: benzoate-CoA ligase family protein [Hyphomicrobiaceae bacterium]
MTYPRIYNAAADMVDRNVGQGRAAKPAFIDPSETLTYGALQARCNQMANLLETYALPRESRIALMLLDTVDFPVAFWGAIKAGVVPVALNTLLTTEQYAYILADSRAKALFISAPLLPVVQPILGQLPFLTHVFVSGGEPPPFALSFRSELGFQSEDCKAAETCCDETAFWLYSSGSTGMPKGVRHVHSSPMETARLCGQQCIGVRQDDVVFSAAKLFFAYGLGNGMSFPMSVGATTILLPERPTPESVFRTLKEHQPTVFFGVPTLYSAMLAYPQGTRENGSQRLRLCVSAGEALPEEVGKAFRAKFGVDILDGVGSTEMLHQYVCNSPGDVRYGTSGKPVPGYEIRLVDEHGQDVADGEVGEMLVKGPSAAEGYWNQREKSRATFEGGWTHSGDKYTRDPDGYYVYQGRTDDMFKVSGIWVSPFEVESALIGHEAVLEAAVVPKEDADGLLKPKAFIVLKPGKAAANELPEALKEYVKAKAGPWKYPRWIEFVDGLPKTATGKIQRYKLREEGAARR